MTAPVELSMVNKLALRLSRAAKRSIGEARAFARQARLIHLDALSPSVPRELADDAHVAVFLHGFMATAGVLRPLRKAVEDRLGLATAALSYPPHEGAAAIESRLASLLAGLPPGARIHLIGHSLGGLVVRHHAVTSGDPRIVQTISLATPFGGVGTIATAASLFGAGGARDLAAGSAFLREVRLRSQEGTTPHLSILASDDVFTVVPASHALAHFAFVVLPDVGHNAILFDDEAKRLVVEALRRRVT